MREKSAQPRRPARARVATLLLLVLVAGSCGRPEIDPRAALEEMLTALMEIESVRYRFEYFDADTSAGPAQRGLVALRRSDLSGSAFMADWEIEDLRAGAGDPFVGQRTSDRVIAYDSEAKRATWSWIVTAAHSVQGIAGNAFMYPFFDPRSVQSEIEAESVGYEGRGRVLGQECDWIRVGYADDDEDSRWCLGVRDRLPRALEWIEEDVVSSSLHIGDLEPEPEGAFVERPVPSDWTTHETRSGPATGSPAMDWTLSRADGSHTSLADLRGKVVVLDFWASWCPPCLAELPALEELLADYDDRLVVAFAVNVLESLDENQIQGFLRERDIGLDVLLAGDAVHDAYSPGNLPALTVIDPTGRNVGTMTGFYPGLSEEYVRRLVDLALEHESAKDGAGI